MTQEGEGEGAHRLRVAPQTRQTSRRKSKGSNSPDAYHHLTTRGKRKERAGEGEARCDLGVTDRVFVGLELGGWSYGQWARWLRAVADS